MGKIKKILAWVDDKVCIELNEGSTEDIIHIQGATWRVELSESEYRELVAAVLCAGMELRWRKGISTSADLAS